MLLQLTQKLQDFNPQVTQASRSKLQVSERKPKKARAKKANLKSQSNDDDDDATQQPREKNQRTNEKCQSKSNENVTCVVYKKVQKDEFKRFIQIQYCRSCFLASSRFSIDSLLIGFLLVRVVRTLDQSDILKVKGKGGGTDMNITNQ